MELTPTLQNITNFMRQTFSGRLDKSGLAYSDHSYRVGEKAATFGRTMTEKEGLWIVGVCHDLLEDSDTTEDDLRNLGVAEVKIEAIKAVTNKYNNGEKIYTDYQKFVGRAIEAGFLATVVKFVDVMDNLSRPKHKGFKYDDKLAALAVLSGAMQQYVK